MLFFFSLATLIEKFFQSSQVLLSFQGLKTTDTNTLVVLPKASAFFLFINVIQVLSLYGLSRVSLSVRKRFFCIYLQIPPHSWWIFKHSIFAKSLLESKWANTVLTEGHYNLALPGCICWNSERFPSPSLGISYHQWICTYKKGFPQFLVAVSCACLQAAREKMARVFQTRNFLKDICREKNNYSHLHLLPRVCF